jgi:hypothetical protein
VQAAYAAYEGLAPPRGYRRDPMNVFDQSMLEDEFTVSKIEVP